jgi:hypothetical protein
MVANGGCSGSVWTFTPTGSATYSAAEAGCASGHGTARRQGDRLVVDATDTRMEAFRYVWELPPNTCGKANGTIAFVKGDRQGQQINGSLEPIP